ncbi:hypothetical protein L6164_008897 [Bauhinia variegata]|uniref:Uncharacterized protein n=1 Tax=Bauhinia variegata TaxID=167791 RepID=A0ACB9PI36_BAUVA|nr:hypothetical protein L6164_008897 [Bauhinia variegata]
MACEPANETLNPEPELSNAPSKIREEGELSSSDNGDVIAIHQENPDSSFAQPSDTISPAAESNSETLVNKDARGVKAGSNNIQLRSTMQSTSQKSFNKNQLPPKSVVWSAHTGTNKNLVISFSDDDSGSDFEENGRGKVVELKGNASRLDRNQKPPISSLVKSNKLQHNARSVQKAMPKRFSLSRTFVSSNTKVTGPNYKGPRSQVGQGSQARNFNTLNRSSTSWERGCEPGVVSNDNKLQDLRQQIALRESELKLKASQQNKESASVLGRDNISMKPKLKNDTARKHASVSTEIAQLEPKEPDRKRLKLGKSYAGPQTFGSQKEVLTEKSKLSSKETTRKNCIHWEKNKVDHNQNEVPLCRGESTITKSQKQYDKLPHIPLQGADVNNGYSQTEKSDKPVEPSVAFNLLPDYMTSNSLPNKLGTSKLIHPPSSSLDNASLKNLKTGMDYREGIANVSQHSSTDLQSFLEMEELIDKELEEAQEHRHKCEIEERNALKVYLTAQRALLEANARCTRLYHKRELYSSKLRSFILNNSSFSWSSGQHEHLDMGLGYLGNVPRHGRGIPTSSYQRQDDYNDINQPAFDSSNQGVNGGPSNTSDHLMAGGTLGSEPCSEPDASTSEQLLQRGADGVYSPSDELDTSANENDEMSPAGHVSTGHDAEHHWKQDSQAKLMDIDTASNTRFCAESAQDSFLLEARLRSELFARLGTRASICSSACNKGGPAAEREAENEVESEKSQMHQEFVPTFPRVEENDLKGSERQERSVSVDPAEIEGEHNIGKTSLNSGCRAGSRDQGHQTHQSHHLMNAMDASPLIFRSAFTHLNVLSLFKSKQVQSIDQQINANDKENARGICINSDETQWGDMSAVAMPVTVGNFLSEKSSYSFSPSIDPFWPLCMYELRGKCNNDECPWQHVKDYSDGNVYQPWQTSSTAGCQGGLTLHQQSCNGVAKVPKNEAIIMPSYLVGLDILRADQLTYKSVLANRNTQCWQKFFSITLATSKLLQTGLQEDGLFLHGGDERVEIHGIWNKQFSSFQWRSGAVNPIEQALADNEQAIDMALLILNQEINKVEGIRKVLSVLSRALETDPTSLVLWIVYLLIYYGNMKPIGKDDMFLFAVKHKKESYVLWLMYINSRRQLDERLAAYDAALLALSQHASDVGDGMHASACILDLFLQMMDFLCMSGNVEKAIQRSYGLFPPTTKSNEPQHLSLSDILNCLTISDKCVFWVCCFYLVIYRKLPDGILQRFECEKELLDIEWPFVHKPEEEKQMAIKLVEIAVESVDSFIYNESVKSEVNLRSAQLFALNHIRCMVALGSLEVLRNLLDKYVKLYPSCIELVLISGRIQNEEIGIGNLMSFEEAINRWPKEVPGIQCIWNQYIENAFHNGRIDFAKEITVRWFHSVWQVQSPQNGATASTDSDNSCGSLELTLESVPDISSSDCNQMDVMFKYLNLSIYKYLQNDEREACIAVDKARNAAFSGGLNHCLRKHTMFLLIEASGLKGEGPKSAIQKILKIYTDDSYQAFLVPKLLTRKFVDDLKKPRVQQLISDLLRPVSFDCSLLNMILQSWYGSSLLPQTFSDSKYLVDFVEDILEVMPSNYQLAIAVCKLLGKFNSADLTSAGLWFWACSTLVNAILVAIPIPPEYVWVEAGQLMHNVVGISERFYKRALTVYPFSVRLWKSFHNLRQTIGDASDVVEAAKERGIQLDAL